MHLKGKAIAEQELIEHLELEKSAFFSDIFEKFSVMMTHILTERNIILESYRINKPITEKQFATLEKYLKQLIPKSIREFCSIFGSI